MMLPLLLALSALCSVTAFVSPGVALKLRGHFPSLEFSLAARGPGTDSPRKAVSAARRAGAGSTGSGSSSGTKIYRPNKEGKRRSAADTSKPKDASTAVKLSGEDRLQKVIARAGISSRREAEKLILDGRVVVNGNIVTELGTKVNVMTDIITFDGRRVELPDAKSVYWVVVNKPRDTLTTVTDDLNRETILDLVPKARELRLLPVGRLDRMSTGLMILTNENGWIHPLTHPSYSHRSRHEVVVSGVPSEMDLTKLRDGGEVLPPLSAELLEIINLNNNKHNTRPKTAKSFVNKDVDDAPLRPIKPLNILDYDRQAGLCIVDIILEDHRPMLMQRIFHDFLKTPIVGIKRTEFGPIALKGLRKGQWRELTQTEIEKLKASCRSSNLPDGSSSASSFSSIPARDRAARQQEDDIPEDEELPFNGVARSVRRSAVPKVPAPNDTAPKRLYIGGRLAPKAGLVKAAPKAAPEAGLVKAAPKAAPEAGLVKAAPKAAPEAGLVKAAPKAAPKAGLVKRSAVKKAADDSGGGTKSGSALKTEEVLRMLREQMARERSGESEDSSADLDSD